MRLELLGKLPPFMNNVELVTKNQQTVDIIDELLKGHDKFANDYDKISSNFWKGSVKKSCKYVFDFLKKNVHYKIEPDTRQSIKSPAAIIATGTTGGFNDCKHYSSFFGGLIDSWSRKKFAGKPINWCYRFANYKLFQDQPHHVFVVVKLGGNELWCDAVLKQFDQKKQYVNKIDKKPMALYRISGIGCNNCNGNYNDSDLSFGIPQISGKIERKAKRKVRREKRRSGENCTGRSLPKYAPPLIAGRKAFLLLIRLNVKKLGLKMYYALNNPETRQKALEKWCAMGGNAAVLKKTVEKFANKYKRKYPGMIGFDPATVTAAIAAAAPYIAAFTPIIAVAAKFLPPGKAQDLLQTTTEAAETLTSYTDQGATTSGIETNYIWGAAALAGIYLLSRKM